MIFKQLSKSLFYGLLFVSISCFAQDVKDLRPPSIDDDDEIPVLAEDLPLPEEDEDYVIRYFSGVTDGEESRIAIKNFGYILRPAMVQVFTESGDELEVKIVRKNWEEIERSGKTRNGRFENVFKTARQFGIIISGAKKGIEFIVAVSAGHELFPQSTLFVASENKRSSGAATLGQEATEGEDEVSSGNILTKILIGIAALIAILLLVLILKKNKKTALCILLLCSLQFLEAGRVRAFGARLGREAGKQLKKMGESLQESTRDFFSDPSNIENLSLLSSDDQDFEPDMDPRGQPNLPTSCLATAQLSQSRPSNFDSRPGRSGNSDEGRASENNSYADDSDALSYANGGEDTYSANESAFNPDESGENKGVFVNGVSRGKESIAIRMPKYDKDGYLLAFGDFPSAPKRIDSERVDDQSYILEQIRQNLDNKGQPKPASGKPEAADGSVFVVDSDNGTSYTVRLPKYDKDGCLLAFGDFPSAPKYINPERVDDDRYILEQIRLNMGNTSGVKPDSNGGNPSNQSVFIEGSEVSTSNGLRLPKYDKDGNIQSFGDFPQAPKQIDPTRVNDERYIREQIQRNIDNKGEPKGPDGRDPSLTDNGSQNTQGFGNEPDASSDFEGQVPGEGRRSSRREVSESDLNEENATEGCQCLKKAYKDFNHNRYTLEKLKKIGIDIKKTVDFGLAFGDNFSGVHAVSGLVWQKERFKIIKKMESFDNTYTNKYNELIDLQYQVLQQIDYCEKMLGEDNWYGRYGFIYYEFIKVHYASYD
ncbi:MAG: hypothetical protein AAGD88_11275 [Bacteroidota bacterium]